MKKDSIKFLSFYLISFISDKITMLSVMSLIFSLEPLMNGYGLLVVTLNFIIWFLILYFLYVAVSFIVYSKKNKNAAIMKITHSFTMIGNPKLRGKDHTEIMNILNKDYKDILDYGIDKYPNGIKITTHALVVKNLIDMGYGTKKEYSNCISKKKYIIKEKFSMLKWKQFKKYFKALIKHNHKDKDYLDAKKLLKPHNRYIFIIKRDDNNQIKIEKVK